VNGCALLGGETAEMPGFYAEGEYDVAGFIVGVVGRSRVIDGRGVVAGDQLIALPSSGLHTNGYSLARRIVFDELGLRIDSVVPELKETVGAALLRPHRSYLKDVMPLLDQGVIKGMAHITGGGITENLPRTLPEGLGFTLDRQSWAIPPLFTWLQRAGGVTEAEMFRAFNMGVGLVLVCAPASVPGVLSRLGPDAWVLGRVG
jgi:phosphoribosylformylglycinamidine cyclo-ligase